MSEYKTLDGWFPDGKPDGRKFWRADWADGFYFVPYFRSLVGLWYGLGDNGIGFQYSNDSLFKEWTPPKKTKKITMYKPIYKGYADNYRSHIDDEWHTDKQNFHQKNVFGWLEMTCEVEE